MEAFMPALHSQHSCVNNTFCSSSAPFFKQSCCKSDFSISCINMKAGLIQLKSCSACGYTENTSTVTVLFSLSRWLTFSEAQRELEFQRCCFWSRSQFPASLPVYQKRLLLHSPRWHIPPAGTPDCWASAPAQHNTASGQVQLYTVRNTVEVLHLIKSSDFDT